jgi:chromosome segregation ATPase
MDAPAIAYLNQKEKPKREGFKWGHELREWKCAHAELKKKYEDLVSKTLEENEGFLGEVHKSGYKDGHSDGYMEAEEKNQKEIENLKKELAELKKESEEQIEAIAELEEERHTLFERKEYLEGELLCVCALNERLKKENEELRLEIENLKTELAGDDARMNKMEEERIQEVQKLRAEIAILQGVSKNGKLKRVNPSK